MGTLVTVVCKAARRALVLALQISEAKLSSHVRTSIIILFFQCCVFVGRHIVQRLVGSFVVVVVSISAKYRTIRVSSHGFRLEER